MKIKQYHKKNLYLVLILILSPIFLTGCIENSENRGFMTEFTDFDNIEQGKTTKKEALRLLGSPSSRSNFGADKWYYISMKLRQATLTTPKMAHQDIVVIEFDENDIVSGIHRKSIEDSRNIIISEDITPTEGNSIGLIEQLLGNMGKFEKK